MLKEIIAKDINSPEAFREEIIVCLAEESCLVEGTTPEEKLVSAEEYLRKIFREADANYTFPTFRKLLAVMKLLMAYEYRAGKDSKAITGNFLKISNRIKKVCS